MKAVLDLFRSVVKGIGVVLEDDSIRETEVLTGFRDCGEARDSCSWLQIVPFHHDPQRRLKVAPRCPRYRIPREHNRQTKYSPALSRPSHLKLLPERRPVFLFCWKSIHISSKKSFPYRLKEEREGRLHRCLNNRQRRKWELVRQRRRLPPILHIRWTTVRSDQRNLQTVSHRVRSILNICVDFKSISSTSPPLPTLRKRLPAPYRRLQLYLLLHYTSRMSTNCIRSSMAYFRQLCKPLSVRPYPSPVPKCRLLLETNLSDLLE